MNRRIPYYRKERTLKTLDKPKHVREDNPQRREDQAFYKSARWRKLRAYMLRRFPTCQAKENGLPACDNPASHVHHIQNRKQFPALSYTISNLSCLCVSCHSTLEARKQP